MSTRRAQVMPMAMSTVTRPAVLRRAHLLVLMQLLWHNVDAYSPHLELATIFAGPSDLMTDVIKGVSNLPASTHLLHGSGSAAMTPAQLESSLLPTVLLAADIGALRELVNNGLLSLRDASQTMLMAAGVVAVLSGVVVGDRSSTGQRVKRRTSSYSIGWDPDAVHRWDEGAARAPSPSVAEGASSLREEELSRPKGGLARALDDDDVCLLGDDVACSLLQAAEKPEATGERINVSNGRWLELAFCIALDAAGNWSFYYPIGELSDLLFGLVFAFTINLLFNWPMVAAFVRAHVKPGVLARTAGAFWEEVLPFTDFVPTATLAWTFVTSGSRRRLRDAIGGDDARLRGSRLMAGIRGVPAVDRRAYEQAEAYLTPKKELLDE